MSNKVGIKNNICVKVFKKDGSLKQKVEGHNFVSVNMDKWAELTLKTMLCNYKNYSRNYSIKNVSDFLSAAFITWLYCTDDTNAESPTTEVTIPGNVVADADLRKAFAQTTGTQGSISESESVCDNKKAKFIAEWIGDTGNGTFQSVCLGRINPYVLALPNPIEYDYERNLKGIEKGGGFAWSIDYDSQKVILKLDETTFEFIEEIDLTSISGFSFINDITYYNDELYFSTGSGVWKYNLTTATTTQVVVNTRIYYGITNDGSHFFTINDFNNTTVLEYEFDGTFSNAYTNKSANASLSLAIDGNNIYTSNSDGHIYQSLFSTTGITLLADYGTIIYGLILDSGVLKGVMRYNNIDGDGNTILTYGLFKFDNYNIANLFDRVLLPFSVTKNLGETMRVEVTITF